MINTINLVTTKWFLPLLKKWVGNRAELHFAKTAGTVSRATGKRVHNRFCGMRDLAIFCGDTRNASWKQERDVAILITSGSGISYFYGDGMRES